jgi:protein-S-isoprenylcysteine O-methyltransferase Ste14
MELHLLTSIKYCGLFILAFGIIFSFIAARSLKGNFKSSLKPQAGGDLVVSGLYGIVRHPAYSGILLMALGISLWMDDATRMLLTFGLFVFLNAKASVEESWLAKNYPEYVEYKRRVPKRFFPRIF